MPFQRVDADREQAEFEELLSIPEAREMYNEFEREYIFRQKLAEIRKQKKLTQQDIQYMTGIPQQAISRIEKGTAQKQSPTLRTLLKYIDAIGCELTITQREAQEV